MAVYYLNYAPISRKAGQSAIAAAAYRATAKLTGLDGKVHNYTRKTQAVYTAMLHSADAPAWTDDRGEFWRQVETKENRSNSELAKSIILALPKELTEKDGRLSKNMIALVETWAKKEFVDHGLVADISIHAPSMKGGKSNNNWHAHVLVSTRAIGKDGWSKNKDRRLSGADRRKHLDEARADWASIVNAELARCGINERISEKRAVSKDELEEALAKDEKYQSLLKKKAQLEAQMRQPKPVPVQKPKTAEQLELEKITTIVNGFSRDRWQTVLYGDAGTQGSLKAYKASALVKAKAMYIANNTQKITAVVNPMYATAKMELESHQKKKPSEVVKKGNFFMAYRDGNGNEYTKYADYKAAQEKLLSKWNKKRTELAAWANTMTAIVNAGKSKDWHKLAELIDKHLQGELAETIKAGAKRLLDTAKEFLSYRAYIKAVEARQTREKALRSVQNRDRDTSLDR